MPGSSAGLFVLSKIRIFVLLLPVWWNPKPQVAEYQQADSKLYTSNNFTMSCNYNCATLPTHQQVECNQYANGGISMLAWLDCDHTITDLSNATQWNTNISAHNAFILKDIKGEVPDPSPVMVDNPVGCGAQQIMIGQDNTINWTDSNVMGANDDFYAKVNTRQGYLVVFMCEEDEIRVSSELVTMAVRSVMIPNDNRALQMYNGTATFFSKIGTIPMVLYSAPSGIFVS